jgi:hypothetical protein
MAVAITVSSVGVMIYRDWMASVGVGQIEYRRSLTYPEHRLVSNDWTASVGVGQIEYRRSLTYLALRLVKQAVEGQIGYCHMST